MPLRWTAHHLGRAPGTVLAVVQRIVDKHYAEEVVAILVGIREPVEVDLGKAGTWAAVAELVEEVRHTDSRRAAIDMCFESVVTGKDSVVLPAVQEVAMWAEERQRFGRSSLDLVPVVLEAVASLLAM